MGIQVPPQYGPQRRSVGRRISPYVDPVYGEQGWAEIDIRNWEQFYVGTLERAVAMAETKTPPYPIDWAVEVIGILTALLRSAENGGQRILLSEL